MKDLQKYAMRNDLVAVVNEFKQALEGSFGDAQDSIDSAGLQETARTHDARGYVVGGNIYIQSQAPENPAIGTIWFDTSSVVTEEEE